MTNLYPTIIVLLQLIVSILQGSHGNLTKDQFNLVSQAVQLAQSATIQQNSLATTTFDFTQPVLPPDYQTSLVAPILPQNTVPSARIWNLQIDSFRWLGNDAVGNISWDSSSNSCKVVTQYGAYITKTFELNQWDYEYQASFAPLPEASYEFWVQCGNVQSKPCQLEVSHYGNRQSYQCPE